MPELPEVETVRRVLAPQVAGLAIERARVLRPQVIAHPSPAEFCAALAGQTIADLGRRGKFLRILLLGGDVLVLHLRMTGCLLLVPATEALEKHTHVVLSLSDGRELRFIDPRRFGRFWLVRKGEAVAVGLDKLGPEPLAEGVSAQYLRARCGTRRRAIKDCLLDQSLVAGIGNIYADEILFAAGIRPDCPAKALGDADWQRLATLIPARLAYFVEKNAITPKEYLAGRGRTHHNTPHLQVYGRAGLPCAVCGEPLARIVVAGRGSVYCPRCQALARGEGAPLTPEQ